jgi:hypothetical protein
MINGVRTTPTCWWEKIGLGIAIAMGIGIIVIGVLAATAWGQDSTWEKHVFTFGTDEIEFRAPSGRVWQLVEDSTPKYGIIETQPNDTFPDSLGIIKWEYSLTGRLVKPVDTTHDTTEVK